jgi:Arc/MetJ family transcription regulator
LRTTIEVPEGLMSELMALSKTRKKKDAVRNALEEFVRRKKVEKLLALPGNIEISDMSAELEGMELDEYEGND